MSDLIKKEQAQDEGETKGGTPLPRRSSLKANPAVPWWASPQRRSSSHNNNYTSQSERKRQAELSRAHRHSVPGEISLQADDHKASPNMSQVAASIEKNQKKSIQGHQ